MRRVKKEVRGTSADFKNIMKIEKCRKTDPLGRYGFPKMFLLAERNTSRLNLYKRDIGFFLAKMEISLVGKEGKF